MGKNGLISPTFRNVRDEYNVIQYWFFQDCSVPWFAYVEALRPWAHELSLALVTPQWKELVEDMVKPRSLRSGRHGRRGRKGGEAIDDDGKARKRKARPIPNVDDMVADKLKLKELGDVKIFKDGRRAFMLGYEQFDRAGWLMFLGEQVDELIWAPIIGTLKKYPKNCPNYCWGLRQGDAIGWGTANPNWIAFPMGTLQGSNLLQSPNAYGMMPLSGDCLATFSATCYNDNTGPTEVGFRMLRSSTMEVICEEAPRTIAPGDTETFCLSGPLPELVNMTMQIKETAGVFIMEHYTAVFQISD